MSLKLNRNSNIYNYNKVAIKKNNMKNYYSFLNLIKFLYKNNENFILINFLYFNSVSLISFNKFLNQYNFIGSKLLSKKLLSKFKSLFNLCDNLQFLKSINFIIKLNNDLNLDKSFFNLLLLQSTYSEYIEFIYLKLKTHKKLISISYLLYFFKNKKIIFFYYKLLKLLKFNNLYFLKILKIKK